MGLIVLVTSKDNEVIPEGNVIQSVELLATELMIEGIGWAWLGDVLQKDDGD